MEAPHRQRLWPGFGPVVAAILGKRRSLARDAPRILARYGRPPRIIGAENIPADYPCILVVNHYERPGLWVGWIVAAVSATVAERRPEGANEVRWIGQGEWTEHRALGLPLPRALSRLFIRRSARVYGQIVLPLGESRTGGRSAAIRAAAAALATDCVGFFPEGYTSHALRAAKLGSGTLLALLSRGRVPVVPVGAAEEAGRLVIRFGPPFLPPARAGAGRAELDPVLRRRMMVAIGALLPGRLWGAYRAEIAAARFEVR
jgi:1-acyl-sn-glycerol-3-phosphate acyltransferase